MKRQHYILFSVDLDDGDRFKKLLARIDCMEGGEEAGGWVLRHGFQYTFDAEDPRLKQLRTLLESERLDCLERIHDVYTYAELHTFPLLLLGFDGEPIISGAPRYGTTHDLSHACPKCGTGAVQTSPLMVDFTELRKKRRLCEAVNGGILICDEVADAFRAEHISGVELRQVRFYRNNEPLPWWQIISTYEMPKFGPETKNIARDIAPGWGCPVCERDMYAHNGLEPSQFVYDRREVDPDQLPDVVHSWECFGRSILHDDPENSLVRGFATPLPMVKPKVMDLLRRLKARKAIFEPVWVR